MKEERIIFFGSGDFPRETFMTLLLNTHSGQTQYKVVGLVTSYDKCEDKGQTLREIAVNHNIPYYVVSKKCDGDCELEEWCKNLHPTLFTVISFKKIPTNLLKIVDNRAFNVHASLLPLLSGSNPIRWAIRNQLVETGLTAIELSDKIDGGDVIDNITVKINCDDTYGTLKETLSNRCATFTNDVINRFFVNGEPLPHIQQSNCGNKNAIFCAPKVNLEYFVIKPNEDVLDVMKSLAPYDGLRCTLHIIETQAQNAIIYPTPVITYNCIIWKAHWGSGITQRLPINIVNSQGQSETNLFIDEIQIEGKKRMTFSEFANGFKYLKKSPKKVNNYKVVLQFYADK